MKRALVVWAVLLGFPLLGQAASTSPGNLWPSSGSGTNSLAGLSDYTTGAVNPNTAPLNCIAVGDIYLWTKTAPDPDVLCTCKDATANDWDCRGDNVTSINAEMGDEAAWQKLLAQTSPAKIPDDFHWFYVDPDNGNDSNTCGPGDPCKTMTKLSALAAIPKTAVAVDVGTMTGTELASGINVTPNCSSSAADAGELCAYIVARKRLGTTSTWVDALPTEYVDLDTTVDGNDTITYGVITIGDTAAPTSYGTVAIEGFRVTTDTLDGFSQKGSARSRIYRSICISTATGATDQCFTGHETGSTFATDVSGTKTDGDSFTVSAGSAKMTLLGNGQIELTDTPGPAASCIGAGDPWACCTGAGAGATCSDGALNVPIVAANDASQVFIGGLTMYCNPTANAGASPAVVGVKSGAHTGSTVTTVRNLMRACNEPAGNDGYGFLLRGGASTTYTINSYQDTLYNADRAISTITAISGTSAIALNVFGMLIEPVTNLTIYLLNGFETAAAVTATFNHVIYDEDDVGTGLFKIGAAGVTEFAAFDTTATRWTFTDTVEEGSTNDSQYVTGTAACNVGMICQNGLDLDYTVMLPECIEAWDAGSRLCGFNLHGRNIGAR